MNLIHLRNIILSKIDNITVDEQRHILNQHIFCSV